MVLIPGGMVEIRTRHVPFSKRSLVLSILLALATIAPATVTMQTMFGPLTKPSGTPVENGRLWIMVYDENNDGQFPGGLGTDASLTDPGAAYAAFAGKTLEVGTIIEGDRIFAVGGIDDTSTGVPGLTQNLVAEINIDDLNLQPGRKWAFYWFADIVSTSPQIPGRMFSIGGINEISRFSPIGNQGMTIPEEGHTVTIAIYADSLPDGTLPVSRFQSIAAEKPNDFASWIAGFFPEETDPAIIGFDADPDADGLDNGVESILGTPPNVPNSGLESPAASAPGTLTFLATLAKNPPSNVQGFWEWSRDLEHWFESGAGDGTTVVTFTETIVDETDPVRKCIKITAESSGEPSPLLFARLAASQGNE